MPEGSLQQSPHWVIMAVKFRLGNRFYSKQRDMIEWCVDHAGDGGWIADDISLSLDKSWGVVSMFGISFFMFADMATALQFAEKFECRDCLTKDY